MSISQRIQKLIPYYAFGTKFSTDLSLSENPLGCSERVLEFLRKNINKEMISSYPDPSSKELKLALSRKYRVSERKITLGNGSEQLIDLVARALLEPGKEVIIPEVTFPMFENISIIAGAIPIFSKMKKDFSIDLENIRSKITNKTKLIFLCNPNNPTGKILRKEEILRFIKAVQPVDVVVDEANIEFIEFGDETVIKEVKEFNNLIVLRTFSKGYGLAGLRIGVCIARENLIETIDKIRQPFPLNSLAQKCALIALRDDRFIEKTKKIMSSQRKYLTEELRKRGFEVIDSQSNNILVKVDKLFGSSTHFVRLLNNNSVSVVDGINFRGLGDKFIRISPRLPQVNKKFIEAIDRILSTA